MYETKNETRYYTSPANGYRDTIRAGVQFDIIGSDEVGGVEWAQISGQDPNPWKAKWVRMMDIQKVDTTPPPVGDGPAEINIESHDVTVTGQGVYRVPDAVYRKVA